MITIDHHAPFPLKIPTCTFERNNPFEHDDKEAKRNQAIVSDNSDVSTSVTKLVVSFPQ